MSTVHCVDWKQIFENESRKVEKEIRKMLDKGTDVNAKNKNQKTALHLAAKNGYVEVARLLILRGIDINAQAYKGPNYTYWGRSAKITLGWTALHYAARSGFIDIVRLLLDCGADFEIWSEHYETPFQVAWIKRNPQTVWVMIEYGAVRTGGRRPLPG